MPLSNYSPVRDTNATIPPGDIRVEEFKYQQIVNSIRQIMADLAGFLGGGGFHSPVDLHGDLQDQRISMSGGNAFGQGANIELYGPTHASFPSHAFYDATMHRFRSADGSVTFADLTAAEINFGAAANTGFQINNVSNVGFLDIHGGSGTGARVLLFGTGHATSPSEGYYDAQEHHFRSVAGTQWGLIQNNGAFSWSVSGVNHYFESTILIGQSSTTLPGPTNNTVGLSLRTDGPAAFSSAGNALYLNRTGDGQVAGFYSAGVGEGSISIAGAVCSYNAFMGSHWSQLASGAMPNIRRGTICESIAKMSRWPNEKPESNERLPCFKISDTPGSKAVYGVFFAWDIDDPIMGEDGEPLPPEQQPVFTNDALIAGLGAFIIRMTPLAVCAIGDLIESNGDGTGRVQADDIFRASTVAKITSTMVQWTYPDGSYLLPCTLHCG